MCYGEVNANALKTGLFFLKINFQLTFDFPVCAGLRSARNSEPRIIDQRINSPEVFNCFFDGIFDLALVRYTQFEEGYLVFVLLSDIISPQTRGALLLIP